MAAGLLQIALLVAVLALVHVPLGRLLASTATGTRHLGVERGLYRVLGVDPDAEQSWRHYLVAVLGFSLVGCLGLYALLRLQSHLPLALGHAGVEPLLAFNTAVSFVTNTNWQAYSGESALGTFVQAAGLGVQNFTSAATGIAVAFALTRGLARRESGTVGNFWVDLVRVSLRVLLPLAVVLALAFVATGVVQNLLGPTTVTTLDGGSQTIPGGTVASQEAIKQLGTNGGGYFNANAAHPFENPTPLSNLLSVLALLVIPFSLPAAFGRIVGDARQGRAVLAVMGLLWACSVAALTWAEVARGTMEGKEQRFGVWASALYAASTTSTSTGAVNAMHDSLSPAGGGVALFSMLLGEVSPGGVGSGLYGLLVLAILTVFVAGLMVGRTPEYLGKKIGRTEISAVCGAILAMPLAMLLGSSVAVLTSRDALTNVGPHGLSEILYAFASAANNNGSAFGGLSADTPVLNLALGLAMLAGRFVPMACVLALAGAFAAQRRVPAGPGTLPTTGPLFITLTAAITVIVSGLTFVPALALGPVAEALQ